MTATTFPPTIEASGITYDYTSAAEDLRVLNGIDLTISKGEFIALVGPSGCGKTTLLTLIGGIKAMQSGSLRVLDCDLSKSSIDAVIKLRSRIGFIFQYHHLAEFLTAGQNVQIGMESNIRYSFRERQRKSREYLAMLGIGDKYDSYPSMLSGGQKQRVACARALSCEPELILADEPTASLDSSTGHRLMVELRRIAAERGMTIVMATHDHRMMDLADRLIELKDGHLVSQAPSH